MLKDVLGYLGAEVFVYFFVGVVCCFGKGEELKRNSIQHKYHESRGNKMRSKLTKLLLGETI